MQAEPDATRATCLRPAVAAIVTNGDGRLLLQRREGFVSRVANSAEAADATAWSLSPNISTRPGMSASERSVRAWAIVRASTARTACALR
jgi:hypothetical protein